MKIFLSWSIVEPSGQFASALHEWLSTTFSHIETWVSSDPECLPRGLSGNGFADKIFENILSSDACIIVVTKESIARPWLYYEAGAFHAQKKHICAILCEGVTHSDFSDSPLMANGINYSNFSCADFVEILTSLHFDPIEKRYKAGLTKEKIKKMVENNFSRLESSYKEIFNEKYIRKHHILRNDSDV